MKAPLRQDHKEVPDQGTITLRASKQTLKEQYSPRSRQEHYPAVQPQGASTVPNAVHCESYWAGRRHRAVHGVEVLFTELDRLEPTMRDLRAELRQYSIVHASAETICFAVQADDRRIRRQTLIGAHWAGMS